MKPATVRAAGGVLWRPSDAGPEIALVHRPRYDDWSLPKGKAEPGEHLLACAVREVREETGCTTRVGRGLGASRYVVLVGGRPARKTVRWWALEATGGTFVPSREVDGLLWLPPGRAQRRMAGAHGTWALRRFVAGPARTSTVLLVPPAAATSATTWGGPDTTRPLARSGTRAAQALAPLLGAYGPSRVAAAVPMRCVETVAPLAASLGTPVEIEPALSREAYDADPVRAHRRLEDVVAAGASSVICVQRQVLAGLVSAMTARVSGSRGTGGVWAISADSGRVVSVELLRA